MGVINVRCSPIALAQMRTMKNRALLSPGTTHEHLWGCVKDIVTDYLSVPTESVALGTMLSGELRPARRVKLGRHRFFYITNGTTLTILLFVGWRKAGAHDDAHLEFERLLTGGNFAIQYADVKATGAGPL